MYNNIIGDCMKKTFKLVALFMGIVLAVAIVSVVAFVLINKNKTYYIYDLRFVEPISSQSGFVYTDSSLEYTTVRNKNVYLSSKNENRIPIAIYADTSLESPNINYKSTNPEVANLLIENGKCYIAYYKVGDAEITINIDKVSDTFKISVFNQSADDFYVYDDKYYGNFAKIDRFQNSVVAYSDGTTYGFKYEAFSSFDIVSGELSIEDITSASVNSDYLRIDKDKLNTDVFEFAEIDAYSKKLMIKCKTGLTENSNEQIVIQSYTYSVDGELKTNNPYIIDVRVIAYTPEFLQVEVATTPDFSEKVLFMDTLKPAIEFNESNIESNIEEFYDFLEYQRAEKYLSTNAEKSTYNVYLTNKTSEIYLRFRMVYTNGDIVELKPNMQGTGEDKVYKLSGDVSGLETSQNGEYYIIKNGVTQNITVTLNKFALSNTFSFKQTDLSQENVELFYTYNAETGFYTYTYWDSRTYYDIEICDKNGNIIEVVA